MDKFIKETFLYQTKQKKLNVPELNISYGIDKNFLYGAGVSVSSVLIHNPDINFTFHIFTDYVDDDYLEMFKETVEKFNTTIIVYLIDPIYFTDLPTSQFWSYATYFRVLSFEYLSESISTLLYLDADVVCKGSLKYITEVKFNDEFAAVIPDNDSTQQASAERLNLPEIKGRYFNAGVIYVNLKKWHEANLTPYLLKLLRGETEYGRLKYLDQDALNIAFNMNNIYISKKYDQIYTLKNELKDRGHQGFKQTITDDTVLIHYTGITKPWHLWAAYPSAQFFNYAREHSPWNKHPLKDARTVAEMQKKYKHQFVHGEYLNGMISLLKYKLKK
ncbi:lipopolysaccharide 1,2-glucosyltransferase [Citrobacter amalonaticus]|uniref:Lipopolysaccharide 1,2-glucosyltransferase n=1 Tax=Citrobacter amalonaticus TaxID=35703 RepID=A0A2S4RV98_CITAM|nr:glycosyltransferase [Citrobacter amalonaticus]POT55639.1 lipopolysaccharide 1,2-glucosyltransferase [Citrobacter amalonaticus]POT73851.1 lipopolysaccharide 1,2-glucosyltransferase [Citrobacter amalonaticus]POU64076.1 lipopolysaccharide 1,2-glucosyltransferase [Citrobacter amalonaticus]POV03708.1 lipopolysaccharide 1,2-glucosyltransferase [Citrobacter amalonaticus]